MSSQSLSSQSGSSEDSSRDSSRDSSEDSSDQPSSDQPSSDQPSSDQPSSDEPSSVEESSVDEPSSDDPSVDPSIDLSSEEVEPSEVEQPSAERGCCKIAAITPVALDATDGDGDGDLGNTFAGENSSLYSSDDCVSEEDCEAEVTRLNAIMEGDDESAREALEGYQGENYDKDFIEAGGINNQTRFGVLSWEPPCGCDGTSTSSDDSSFDVSSILSSLPSSDVSEISSDPVGCAEIIRTCFDDNTLTSSTFHTGVTEEQARELANNASADEDLWADPKGEYASLVAAAPVFDLLGKASITDPDMPAMNSPRVRGNTGYHIRSGGHGLGEVDWNWFLDFTDPEGMQM